MLLSENYIVKGYVDLFKFQFEAAIKNFEKGLILGNRKDWQPVKLYNPTTICMLLGILHYLMGNYSEAEEYIKELFEIGAENKSVYTAAVAFLMPNDVTREIPCSCYYSTEFMKLIIRLLYRDSEEFTKVGDKYYYKCKPPDWYFF